MLTCLICFRVGKCCRPMLVGPVLGSWHASLTPCSAPSRALKSSGIKSPTNAHTPPSGRITKSHIVMNESNANKAETLAQMYQKFTQEFPEVKGITAEELHELLEGPDAGNIILIDVRTPDEIAVSRLPGPVLFVREEFERVKMDYRDRQLITYCTAGYRSGKYADQLRKEGFAKVRNLEGSILSWTHKGYPLVTGETAEPTKRVHVFGEKWRIQGDGFEAVCYPPGQGALATVKTALPKWLGGQR